MALIKQIVEYTKLCREYSELPRNAPTPEAYAPIEARRQELKGRIEALRAELTRKGAMKA